MLLSPKLLFAQASFQEIAKIALKSGDSQKLSLICAEKVEFGQEGIPATITARQTGDRLASFFRANPPSDAGIQFLGKGKDGRKYMICNYSSRNGSGYRISFYWKEQANPLFESIDISKD